SRRRHTRFSRDWSSDVCSSDLIPVQTEFLAVKGLERMVNTLAMINRSRQQALPYTIVPTLFDRRTQASMSTLRVLRNSYLEHLRSEERRVGTEGRSGCSPYHIT